MVAYTYQLSLFSTVVLIIVAFFIVWTIINWIQRLLQWLSGIGTAVSKLKVKEENKSAVDKVDELGASNNIPDLEQKKQL